MDGRVLLFEVVLAVARAVVGKSRYLVKVLMQGPAEGHIQFLEAAADAQHRHAGRLRRPHQRNRSRVARFVQQCVPPRGRALIMARRDIGAGTGKEQAVDACENLLRLQRRRERGDQQRQRSGAVARGVDIFLADHVKGVVADLSGIANNADDGKRLAHGAKV